MIRLSAPRSYTPGSYPAPWYTSPHEQGRTRSFVSSCIGFGYPFSPHSGSASFFCVLSLVSYRYLSSFQVYFLPHLSSYLFYHLFKTLPPSSIILAPLLPSLRFLPYFLVLAPFFIGCFSLCPYTRDADPHYKV